MGLSLGMKIDEQGNAVPGPTSQMPSPTMASFGGGGGELGGGGDGQEF
jgi:DNA-directed RNA polymerase subunit alpha